MVWIPRPKSWALFSAACRSTLGIAGSLLEGFPLVVLHFLGCNKFNMLALTHVRSIFLYSFLLQPTSQHMFFNKLFYFDWL